MGASLRYRARAAAIAAVLYPAVGASDPLALPAAQAEARAHAPDAEALAARVRGAELAIAPASRVFTNNPVLSASYGSGALVGDPGELVATANVALPVDVSGSWGPRGRSAESDRDRIAFDRSDGLRALDEAVAIAFADVALAQRRVERATRLAKLRDLAATAAADQLRAGQGTQLDVDAAQLDVSAARAGVARATGALDQARARLARALGRTTFDGLTVQDSAACGTAPDRAALARLVDRDPRVRAADAELAAARFELAAAERSAWPVPTLGIEYDHRRREIPVGSFEGASAAGLSAAWSDDELIVSASVPLPLFDRKPVERAAARGRILRATAALSTVRADVLEQLATAWSELHAATEAVGELAATPTTLDSVQTRLEQAVGRGALSSADLYLAIARLQGSIAAYDTAAYSAWVACAHWQRVAGAAP